MVTQVLMPYFNQEDVIFVPVVKNQITVSGSVRRSAKYETLGGETLKDAIKLAGGVNDRAYLENIRLRDWVQIFALD